MKNLFVNAVLLRKFGLQVSHTVPFITLILLCSNYGQCEQSLACGVSVESTCMSEVTTKWNTYLISENLKNWFRSVKRINKLVYKEQPFVKKTLLMFEEKDNISGKMIGHGVQYIANRNCSNKKHFGPTWRKTSVFSSNQFHDGFLYGKEDHIGELTGLCEYVVVNGPEYILVF